MTGAASAHGSPPLSLAGRRGLWGALVGIVGALVLAPVSSLPPPAVALAIGTIVALARTPFGPFATCISLFALTIGYTDSGQFEEVVFAAYYVVYISTWAVLRVVVYGEPLLNDRVDAALAVFFGLLVVSVVPSVAFGADPVMAANELFNYSLFSLVFPARELCRRYEQGSLVVMGLIVLLGLLAVIQNVTLVRAAINDAEMAWEIARGRVAMSEMLLTVNALLALGGSLYAAGLRSRLALLVGFAVFAGAVLLTQSRAYYVDLALGVGLIAVCAPPRARGWLFSAATLGGLLLFALGAVLLGDSLQLILLGIADRVLSLFTALDMDISYLNRALESRAVWALVADNPILGYGTGVSFGFHDAIFDAEWVKTFVHNGFLMLWFKFGVFGLGAVVVAWGLAAVHGLLAARAPGVPPLQRAAGLVAGASLIALVPSHFMSATFSTAEPVVCVALLIALAGGAHAWARDAERTPRPA